MVDVAWRRRFTGASLLLFGILCAMLIVAPPASAHAVLESTIRASVKSWQLTPFRPGSNFRFNEPVEVALGALQVVTADGSRVDARTVQHPDGAGERVSTGLSSRLAQGSYLVLWRVVSADSHPVHGSFTFSIGRIGPVADAPNNAGSYSLELAAGVARFAGYGGLLLVVGGIAFFAWCLPSQWAGREARRLLGVGVAIAGAATVGGFGLQAALDVGGGWEQALDPSTLNALAGTRWGHAHLSATGIAGNNLGDAVPHPESGPRRACPGRSRTGLCIGNGGQRGSQRPELAVLRSRRPAPGRRWDLVRRPGRSRHDCASPAPPIPSPRAANRVSVPADPRRRGAREWQRQRQRPDPP